MWAAVLLRLIYLAIYRRRGLNYKRFRKAKKTDNKLHALWNFKNNFEVGLSYYFSNFMRASMQNYRVRPQLRIQTAFFLVNNIFKILKNLNAFNSLWKSHDQYNSVFFFFQSDIFLGKKKKINNTQIIVIIKQIVVVMFCGFIHLVFG